MSTEQFGMRVRVKLKRMNMTQGDLAKLLGISNAYLSDILDGRRKAVKKRKEIGKILEIEKMEI